MIIKWFKWLTKTRVGEFQHIGKNSYIYEPASITYRKILWWQIPIEKVIEHEVISRAKRKKVQKDA